MARQTLRLMTKIRPLSKENLCEAYLQRHKTRIEQVKDLAAEPGGNSRLSYSLLRWG